VFGKNPKVFSGSNVKVAASTVYRLLERAGWRKVAPRPSHPRKDPAAEEAFKKSSRRR